MRSFSETQPKQDLDPDRVPLKEGLRISIEKIILSDKTQYGLIAKIDGVLLSSKTPGKWYTTSSVIVAQLQDALKSSKVNSGGVLAEPFAALVKKVKSKQGNGYLTLADPD